MNLMSKSISTFVCAAFLTAGNSLATDATITEKKPKSEPPPTNAELSTPWFRAGSMLFLETEQCPKTNEALPLGVQAIISCSPKKSEHTQPKILSCSNGHTCNTI